MVRAIARRDPVQENRLYMFALDHDDRGHATWDPNKGHLAVSDRDLQLLTLTFPTGPETTSGLPVPPLTADYGTERQ